MNFLILCLLFLVYLTIKLFHGHKNQSKSAADLFSANRSLGILGVSLSLIATQIGGGAIIGTAEEAYNNGISAIFYTLGLGLGFLILSFTGASKLRAMQVITVAEIFEKTYKSIFLRKLSSFLLISSLFGILIGQVIASKKIFALAQYDLSIVFWGMNILYIALNGMQAIASMSKLQSFIMYSVFGGILLIVLNQVDISSLFTPELMFDTGIDYTLTFSTLLVPLLFCIIEQDVAQSFFSAKSNKVAVYGGILAAFLLVLFGFIPLLIGVAAKQYGYVGDSILLSFVANKVPSYFTSLANFGILMAIVSTANSLICAISSSITLDFFSNKIRTARIVTIFIGLSAITLGQQSNNLFSVFIESYRILVCTVFFPIFLTYFNCNKKIFSKIGAITSVVTASIVYIYGIMINLYFVELYCIAVQAISYFIAAILYKNIAKNRNLKISQ